MPVQSRWMGVVAGMALCGCKGELPGAYWQLEQTLVEDLCNPQAVNPESGSFDYRVIYDVQDITLAIEEDEFATGGVNGCTLAYETVVWPEVHGDEEYEIAWQMTGSATVSKGGDDGCTVDGGGDWLGTEIFTIITSEDPALSPGCTYTVELTGTFLKEVSDPSVKEEATGTTP